jgi:hypothetical protein
MQLEAILLKFAIHQFHNKFEEKNLIIPFGDCFGLPYRASTSRNNLRFNGFKPGILSRDAPYHQVQPD